MVSIPALWMPILVSSLLVFFASALIHMLLPYHRSDFRKLSEEDGILDALSRFDIPPGDYVLPHAGTPEAMKSEEYRGKVERGPVAFMTVVAPQQVFSMATSLAHWFLYSVLIGVFAAYLGGRMLGPGAAYIDVFRVTGTMAFACYSVALAQRSIWYKQRWATTAKSVFDGFLYALLTAGTFGWLWPV